VEPTVAAAETLTPEPTTAAPTPAPTATQTPTPAPRPKPEMGRLSVTFEHSLKSGTLRIWVDKDLVHEESLSSRVTKDMLVF
jgi:hypothetical protein